MTPTLELVEELYTLDLWDASRLFLWVNVANLGLVHDFFFTISSGFDLSSEFSLKLFASQLLMACDWCGTEQRQSLNQRFILQMLVLNKKNMLTL